MSTDIKTTSEDQKKLPEIGAASSATTLVIHSTSYYEDMHVSSYWKGPPPDPLWGVEFTGIEQISPTNADIVYGINSETGHPTCTLVNEQGTRVDFLNLDVVEPPLTSSWMQKYPESMVKWLEANEILGNSLSDNVGYVEGCKRIADRLLLGLWPNQNQPIPWYDKINSGLDSYPVKFFNGFGSLFSNDALIEIRDPANKRAFIPPGSMVQIVPDQKAKTAIVNFLKHNKRVNNLFPIRFDNGGVPFPSKFLPLQLLTLAEAQDFDVLAKALSSASMLYAREKVR